MDFTYMLFVSKWSYVSRGHLMLNIELSKIKLKDNRDVVGAEFKSLKLAVTFDT